MTALTLATSVIGCTTGGDTPNTATDTHALHPTGPKGAWLSDAYAAGSGAAYATTDTVCAVTGSEAGGPGADGIIVEHQRSPTGPGRVVGRVLATGAVSWEIDGARCSAHGLTGAGGPVGIAADGTLLSDGSELTGGAVTAVPVQTNGHDAAEWSLVAVTTGKQLTDLPIAEVAPDGRAGSVSVLGVAGDNLLIVQIDSSTVAGISVIGESAENDGRAEVDRGTDASEHGSGSAVWSTSPGRDSDTERTDGTEGITDATMLANGRIGLEIGHEDRALVIDGSTGDTLTEVEKPAGASLFWLTWASDGYVLQLNESEPAYAFYDATGAEIDRTSGQSQYRFAPSPSAGVTFTIADHLAAGTTVGIDASGGIALAAERGTSVTQAGTLDELPDSIIGLQGVSSDGSLLLFEGEPEGPEDDADSAVGDAAADRLVLINATGDAILNRPISSGSSIAVHGGYIVIGSGELTQVLLPAG